MHHIINVNLGSFVVRHIQGDHLPRKFSFSTFGNCNFWTAYVCKLKKLDC